MTLADKVKEALGRVNDPELGRGLVELGMVQNLEIGATSVSMTIELTTPACPMKDRIAGDVRAAVASVAPGIPVELRWGAKVKPMGQSHPQLPGVKHVILCASGKGGVGKSTVAANLAAALHMAGAKVGLLDADIYGPSIPVMFKMREKPHSVDNKTIEPLSFRGLKVMSMGYLLEPHQALVWRGPMISKALMQLVHDVAWGELDYLVMDLPPGTGDVQLTIGQQLKVSGAVVVSTPQDVALADVYRAKQMFDQIHTPILGIVENMSYFVCDGCNKRHDIFASGGAREAAKRLDLECLVDVPLDPACRIGGDEGMPVVMTHPDSPSGRAFTELAGKVAAKLAVAADKAAQKSRKSLPIVAVEE